LVYICSKVRKGKHKPRLHADGNLILEVGSRLVCTKTRTQKLEIREILQVSILGLAVIALNGLVSEHQCFTSREDSEILRNVPKQIADCTVP
jgi:hypothetical protein